MIKTYLFRIWLLLILGLVTSAITSCSKDNDDKKESSNNPDCSNPPVIASVDSIQFRTYEIVNLQGSGTPPFTYSIDSLPFDENPVKDKLFFGKHFVYTKDANECCSERFDFTMVPPPIIIPDTFSPLIDIE